MEKSNITERYWCGLYICTLSLSLSFSSLFSSNEVFDLVLYLSDITHSLSSLIAVYPPASPILCKAGVIER